MAMTLEEKRIAVKKKLAQEKLDSQSVDQTGFKSEAERQRYLESLPQLEGVLAGEDVSKGISISPALLTTTDPNEIAQIITSNFPDIKAIYPEEGAPPILVNNNTGVAVHTGKEGIQASDVLTFLGLAAAYTPAGRGAGLTASALGKTAAKEAATETAIQAGQAAAGGEFNVADVATTAALSPVGQIAGEYVTRRVGEGLRGKQVKGAQDIVDFAEAENIDVLTSDIFPPKGRSEGLTRQMAENLPIIGTSAKRAQQQVQRESVASELVDLSESLRFSEADIVSDLKANASATKNAAGSRLENVINDMGQFGDVNTDNTLDLIDSLIESETRVGKIKDDALINKLIDIRTDLIESQDFQTLRENRTTVRGMKDSIDPKSKTQAMTHSRSVLENVYKSITNDLDSFVKNNTDDRYLQRYKKADEIFGACHHP